MLLSQYEIEHSPVADTVTANRNNSLSLSFYLARHRSR